MAAAVAQTLQLRAFELTAGPKSARLLYVNPARSISEAYPQIRLLLRLELPLSDVTFHRTVDKRVDTTPLPTTTPMRALGLRDNDIFVLRRRSRPAQPASTSAASEGANAPPSPSSRAATLVPVSAAISSPSLPAPAPAPAPPSTAAALSAHSSAISRDRLRNHRRLAQLLALRALQLAVAASPSAAVAFSGSPALADVHRGIVRDFGRRAELPVDDLEQALGHGPIGVQAVYEALNYVAADMVASGAEAGVEAWLAVHLPPLRPAARLICVLHASHEAEFLERTLLRLLHRRPTGLAWLLIRDPAAPERRCFHSAVVGLAQYGVPAHVDLAQVSIFPSTELDCACASWGLCSCFYRGHLPPVLSWLWSRLAAAVLTGAPDTSALARDVLGMYGECDAALLPLT